MKRRHNEINIDQLTPYQKEICGFIEKFKVHLPYDTIMWIVSFLHQFENKITCELIVCQPQFETHFQSNHTVIFIPSLHTIASNTTNSVATVSNTTNSDANATNSDATVSNTTNTTNSDHEYSDHDESDSDDYDSDKCITYVKIVPEKSLIICGTDIGSIYAFRDEKCIFMYHLPLIDTIVDIVSNQFNQYAFITIQENTPPMYCNIAKRVVKELTSIYEWYISRGDNVACIQFTPLGGLVIAGCCDNSVQIWKCNMDNIEIEPILEREVQLPENSESIIESLHVFRTNGIVKTNAGIYIFNITTGKILNLHNNMTSDFELYVSIPYRLILISTKSYLSLIDILTGKFFRTVIPQLTKIRIILRIQTKVKLAGIHNGSIYVVTITNTITNTNTNNTNTNIITNKTVCEKITCDCEFGSNDDHKYNSVREITVLPDGNLLAETETGGLFIVETSLYKHRHITTECPNVNRFCVNAFQNKMDTMGMNVITYNDRSTTSISLKM